MEKPNWTEIAGRCEAATGPDREIDAQIACALGWQQTMLGQAGMMWRTPEGNFKGGPPRFTNSRDAIGDITEQEFPRHKISIDQFGPCWNARIHWAPYAGYWQRGNAASEPLARCAAFARAMDAKESAR